MSKVPQFKSVLANAPDVRPTHVKIACAYCYQFKIFSDGREVFHCYYKRVRVTKASVLFIRNLDLSL